MKTHGFIYALDLGGGEFKLGHSCDPKARRRALKLLGCDFLFISKALERVEQVERTAHKIMRPYRVRGERFKAPIEAAIAAVDEAERMVYGTRQDNNYQMPLRPTNLVMTDLDGRHLEIVDELRRVEKDIPTRSEMIRRLIERAADKKGRK